MKVYTYCTLYSLVRAFYYQLLSLFSESNVDTACCMLSITAAATTGTATIDNAANLVENAHGDQTDDSAIDTSIKIEPHIIQEDVTIINTDISNGSDMNVDGTGKY
jgi:phosphate-selective porin